MEILIVDDSRTNRVILEQILQESGYQNIKVAESARDAFEKIGFDEKSDLPPSVDLILLDIVMPEMDGIEACRIIKNSERYRDVPVIMVTARTDDEVLESAFSVGATDFITKPYRKRELLSRVQAALAMKKESDERKIRQKRLLDDLTIAKQVQRSVLSKPFVHERIDINAEYLPSEELSGDMYSWFKISENKYGVILLDVMGHGIMASLVSMSIRFLIQDLIMNVGEPIAVTKELNRHMNNFFRQNGHQRFFTVIYLVIDIKKQEIEYVNAGHPPGILICDGTTYMLEKTTVPIGLMPMAQVKKKKISYYGQTRIALYTDGLIEVPGESMVQGINRLCDTLLDYQDKNGQMLIELVVEESRQQTEFTDDVCMIVIDVTSDDN